MAKNIALVTVLLLVIWAGSFGIAFGVTEWRGRAGPMGPQGVAGIAGPPGPVASPDYCSAALSAVGGGDIAAINAQSNVRKYCP